MLSKSFFISFSPLERLEGLNKTGEKGCVFQTVTYEGGSSSKSIPIYQS